MAENDLDSGQTLEGTVDASTSAGSQATGDKQGSLDAAKLQSAIEALSKQVASLQGDKDRGVQKALKGFDELNQKVAELERIKKLTGLDGAQAYEELEFRDTLRDVKVLLQNQKASTRTPDKADGGAEERLKLFDSYGLDPNSPDAVALSGLSGDALELAVARRVRGRTQPDASEASTVTAKTAPKSEDVEEKATRLKEMYRHPSRNAKAIKELEADLDATNWR